MKKSEQKVASELDNVYRDIALAATMAYAESLTNMGVPVSESAKEQVQELTYNSLQMQAD